VYYGPHHIRRRNDPPADCGVSLDVVPARAAATICCDGWALRVVLTGREPIQYMLSAADCDRIPHKGLRAFSRRKPHRATTVVVVGQRPDRIDPAFAIVRI
jgi:hypothetical protein